MSDIETSLEVPSALPLPESPEQHDGDIAASLTHALKSDASEAALESPAESDQDDDAEAITEPVTALADASADISEPSDEIPTHSDETDADETDADDSIEAESSNAVGDDDGEISGDGQPIA